MSGTDEIRELTSEEKQLIFDYVLSNCTEDEKVVGEHLAKRILSDNPLEGYCRMDFLRYAKEGRKMTYREMSWEVYDN